MLQCGSVRYKVQYTLYSKVQYSTVSFSTVQYGTVWYSLVR
jgi:hypothetical protein